MGRRSSTYPHQNLWNNLDEVDRLLQIHAKVSGSGPGRKYNVAVLHKSAIVLLVACWEAFIEDLAEDAFSIMLRRCKDHGAFPNKVLAEAAKPLKDGKDARDLWKLAGAGWKDVLRRHKSYLFEQYTSKLNTPRPAQVDSLYENLLGIKKVSSSWHWSHMSADQARAALDELIDVRGSIAHRVTTSQEVTKKDVSDSVNFVNRIAVKTSNAVQQHLLDATGKEPWPNYTYHPTKKPR
jgi:RiboL-PSP-HEPN